MKTLAILLLLLTHARAGEEKALPAPDLSWLAGSWKCEIWGGIGEEVYSQANPTGVFGSFRLTKDGKVSLYEMIVIENHPEGTLLRMKHFHFGLKGWEEKNDFVEGKLIESGPKSLTFYGATGASKMWVKYKLIDGDTLETRLVRENPDKKEPQRADLVKKSEDVFRYTRVK